MIPTPEVNGRVPPVVMLPARGSKIPLVFDSPHSGSHYPESFKTLVSLDRMRRAEDAFVDELFAAAPDHGAPLIAAALKSACEKHSDRNKTVFRLHKENF